VSLGESILTSRVRSRLARRGGVKRISGNIYEDCRKALKDHLSEVTIPILRRQSRVGLD
jgi:histone H3/H4